MPGANPLVEDMPGEPPTMFGASGAVSVGGLEGAAGAALAPSGAGEHNTHLWVAGVLLVALAGIVFLHISGFRFSTDVGVTGR